ncbi:hypothetical protein KM043_006590 [Ampulex compressa]|nr:hypothetical protein KM043_006590 [Ampulex compressa]
MVRISNFHSSASRRRTHDRWLKAPPASYQSISARVSREGSDVANAVTEKSHIFAPDTIWPGIRLVHITTEGGMLARRKRIAGIIRYEPPLSSRWRVNLYRGGEGRRAEGREEKVLGEEGEKLNGFAGSQTRDF